jgi:hypothetical protein
MCTPLRQSVVQISAEPGIHMVSLYKLKKAWRLLGAVVPATEKDPDGWSSADKFRVVLETTGLNATEISPYCHDHGLLPEHVEHWWRAS